MSCHTAEDSGVWGRGILDLYTSTGLAHRETVSSLLMEDRSVIAIFQGSVKAAALLAESPCLGGQGKRFVVGSAGLSLGGDWCLVSSGGQNTVSDKLGLKIEFG